MDKSARTQQRANGLFKPGSDQHEKGSAMGLIQEEARRTREKTERLKALRQEREAAAPSAPPKAKPAAKKTRKAS